MNTTYVWGTFILLLWVVFYCDEAHAQSAREVAKKVSPSVVLIVMEDDNGQPLAMGSGFVIKDGIIATNLHVVEGASRGYAKLAEGKDKFNITGMVANDAARDVVLLAVEGITAPGLPFGDSKQVAVGDEVYAVGNPRGLEGTFSAGIVSSIRQVGDDSLVQITAPISPGSSGGPVVNSKGEVIGVAVATFKGGQNLNFAIPSAYVSALITQIKGAVPLTKESERAKDPTLNTIMDNLGGRSTEGVTTGSFLWEHPSLATGFFSLSLRNQLREPVKNVKFLLIFYDKDGESIESSPIVFEGIIAPGLAKRVTGEVDGSVQKLTSGNSDTMQTKFDSRVLYFDLVTGGESRDERSDLVPDAPPDLFPSTGRPVAPNAKHAARPEDVEAALREAEKKLAESVAKLAPAGNGPDLIETNIEGEFIGWEGDTIFKMSNGQIWQQVTMGFTYTYKFRPKVMIIKTNGAYKMKVEGVANTIFVKQIE